MLTGIDSGSLDWDVNGNMTSRDDGTDFYWNWDNKLRKTEWGSNSPKDNIQLRYDPMGNRVWKQVEEVNGTQYTRRKYIVDIASKLPSILLELDCGNNNSVEKSYVVAHSQILSQYDYNTGTAGQYFYLHDRLGSVRLYIYPNYTDQSDIISKQAA